MSRPSAAQRRLMTDLSEGWELQRQKVTGDPLLRHPQGFIAKARPRVVALCEERGWLLFLHGCDKWVLTPMGQAALDLAATGGGG